MMLRGGKEMLVPEVMKKKRRKKKRDLKIETKITIDNCFYKMSDFKDAIDDRQEEENENEEVEVEGGGKRKRENDSSLILMWT